MQEQGHSLTNRHVLHFHFRAVLLIDDIPAFASVSALLYQRHTRSMALAFADRGHGAIGIEHQRIGGADFSRW